MKLHVKIGLTIVILGTGIFCWSFFKGHSTSDTISFTTEKVTRGSVEITISSTGTLNPVGDVEVGTQVSGTIEKVYVDFNDTVQKGQIIAELDRTFLLSAYDEARASHTRSQAQFELSKAEYERSKPLYEKKYLSEQEFQKIRTDYFSQKAALELSEASVKKAKINLGYATISSPISGRVIERSVEVGQTVSASLSAPTLFIIAENLDNMEILASVDESDIGNIRQGQSVRFSVQAYPDRQYDGTVRQIRLQPETIQNVVTYTVVVDAKNPDGTLLPGMTATIDFIENRAENVLLVPVAATQFVPPQSITNQMSKPAEGGKKADKKEMQQNFNPSAKRGDFPPKNLKPGTSNGNFSSRDFNSGSSRNRTPGNMHGQTDKTMIWLLNEDNTIKPAFVKLGISDGVVSEVVDSRGAEIKEGMEVVVGTKSSSGKKDKKSVSLFPQPGGPGGRR
ncbi:MAG: efflux RND transporter periplasmic adaptor subunit [Fibrobacter sp.]|nr:efflux RND transporter periplasmic adaptor subunit [Fibrobacter sp.]